MRVLLAAACLALAGCTMAHCGPTLDSLRVQDEVDAGFTPANRTSLEEALGGAGFTRDDRYAAINPDLFRATRGDVTVAWQPLAGSNQQSLLLLVLELPDREYPDSAKGRTEAAAAIEAAKQDRAEEAQVVWDLARQALGQPSQPVVLQGLVSIC